MFNQIVNENVYIARVPHLRGLLPALAPESREAIELACAESEKQFADTPFVVVYSRGSKKLPELPAFLRDVDVCVKVSNEDFVTLLASRQRPS